MMQVATVLDRAQQLIRGRGWAQGIYEHDKGRLCLEGALFYASRQGWGPRITPGDWETAPAVLWEAEAAVIHYLADYCRPADGRHLTLAHYNDEPDRTLDEVLAALEGAAQAWRAGDRA